MSILKGIWRIVGGTLAFVASVACSLLSPISLATAAVLAMIYYACPWLYLVWFGAGLATAYFTYNLPVEARPFNKRLILGHFALVIYTGFFGIVALGLEWTEKHWPDKWVLGHDPAGGDTRTGFEWDGWRWKEVKKEEAK